MMEYILIICATLALCYSIDFCIKTIKTDVSVLSRHMVFLGIGCALWNLGSACMRVFYYIYLMPYFRRITLAGVCIFVVTLLMLCLYFSEISGKTCICIKILFSVMGMGLIIVWKSDEIKMIYRKYTGAGFITIRSLGYFYQIIYLIILGVFLLVIYGIWMRKRVQERNRIIRRTVFLATLFTFLACVTDIVLPILALGLLPGAPIFCNLSYIIIAYALNGYKKYCISVKNLSRCIYENGEIGFLSFDVNGRLLMLNEKAKQIVGITVADRQRIADIFDLNGLSNPDFLQRIKSENNNEYHFVAKKTDVVCAISFNEVRDDVGEPFCIICTIYDRSKEEEILESIRRSGDAKSSFLASMTHEIRTPINAILGMCEMIDREATDEDVLNYSRSMDKAGEQLLSIVNDVLDYSKIQSGMMDLIPVRYDLRELIHQLVIQYEQEASRKGVEFIYDVNKELPAYLYGDEVRILQILKNLLDNAIKYTDKGRIVFHVYLQKESDDRVILVFVIKDTGRGIRKEEQIGMFDLFMRADHDKNQTIAGTGIGLTIVGNLVNMMQGTIRVESEYGMGSCFTVKIPQQVVSYHQIGDYERSLSEYKAEHKNGVDYEYTAPAAKILIVDDNSVNLSVAKFLLEKTEAKVDVASSGREALERIQKSAYQIIFLDHIMPEMDGIETIKRIREEHLADEVPIIALTANDVAGAKEMYLDYGFQDYLFKPIGKGSLEKKVHDWLPKKYIHYRDMSGDAADNSVASSLSICKLPSDFEGKKLNEECVSEDDNLQNQLTHIFIINPIVASDQVIEEIREYLSKTKTIRYFIFTSTSQGAETELTRRIQRYFTNEQLRIYCIGGSGTIRNVINGIEDFERVEVAFFPMGMTNDFLKVFGNDEEQFKVLKNLMCGKAKKIDYIQTTGGIALNTFSLGLDANTVMMLEKNRIFRMFGKMFPYINAFLYSLFITTSDEYEIYVDDELIYEGVSSEIIFGNGNVLGGMFHFGEKQYVTDGKGCVMIGKKRQGLALLPTVIAMVTGNIERVSQKEIVGEAKSFTIRRKDGGQLAMNFDGEMVYGFEKWDAKIVKQGLKFVVPVGVSIDE